MAYEYQFPKFKDYTFDEYQQMKITEEAGEFAREVRLGNIYKAIVEAFDIIHATETFLRNQEPQLVEMAAEYVVRKNRNRKYYEEVEEDGKEG